MIAGGVHSLFANKLHLVYRNLEHEPLHRLAGPRSNAGQNFNFVGEKL
jgi:hypothetical protein